MPIAATRLASLTATAMLAMAAAMAAATPTPPTPQAAATAPQRPAQAPAEVRSMLQWVAQTADNEASPFIIIDKRRARLWLFDIHGQGMGSTPVLLGLARGDASVPGIGHRPMQAIHSHERTTPAGRFVAEAGHNANGEDIFWIDFDAAVSMHRVRATNPAERRLQRLASPSAADNRISYGCINVPVAFYDLHIRPLFTLRRGVVYLLPETMPMAALFTPVQGRPGAAQPPARP